MKKNVLDRTEYTSNLINDLRTLIASTRDEVARSVNSALVLLYWKVGKRIRQDILKEKRAEYGEEILPTLSAKLVTEFGNGFSSRNLARMVRFAEIFSDLKIVSTLSTQLSWSHLVEIIPLKDDLQRDFYTEMCRIERWSVRTLRSKIGSILFERTALSRKPAKLIKQELEVLREEDKVTPDLIFRDPYLLDFLGLKNTYSEKDLETAILREMESFILELGAGFSFVARQKRMTIDDDDFYLDLLFYHRKLRRLVAIELKLDKFKPEYKGRMELYLRWLEKYEQHSDEGSPIGLILCAGGSEEQIKLLELDKGGIRVAAYLTELPPQDILRKKLHETMILARKQLECKEF
ncbi:MAG: PDDEXK nuclease domain-containing protein [Syntrophorhabdaceae bacterium]|nr:PDDEXK nuclease domain-containing protein [Syntrophorhabdaceae bacterium]